MARWSRRTSCTCRPSTPLQVGLESVDVIHSFHVPQFGWMRDMVPGKTNQMAFFVERAGTYDGTCNQYCGTQARVDACASRR